MAADNYSAHVLVSDYASGLGEGTEETVERLLSQRGLELARVLVTAPPDPAKRQTMATGGALQLRGRPQAVPVATAREVARLSDELNLDEEVCLELWARVTERKARRRLAERLGMSWSSLDGDLQRAAKLLWYLDVESGLGAILEATRGALDARLDWRRRRLLFGHVRRLAESGLVEAMCASVKALSGASWARTLERRRRAGALATTAANCVFMAFYELQMTLDEARRVVETLVELSAKIDDYDDWRQRKAKSSMRQSMSPRLSAEPVTSQPAAPHAARLRSCRDVLSLVVAQAVEPRTELRRREHDMPRAAWSTDDAKEMALGPAFPNALNGDQLVTVAEQRPFNAVAVVLAALALSSPRATDNRLAPEARRRLWKAASTAGGNCCDALSHMLSRLSSSCYTRGSRVVYLEVAARLIESLVEAAVLLEPQPPPTTPSLRRGAEEDDLSDQAADVVPKLSELVASISSRYRAFADAFFILDDEDGALFVRLLRAVNIVARRSPQLGLVPYLTLLGAAAQGSPHRAATVRDALRDDFAPAGLSLRELFDKLQRYCAMLEEGERRYLDHRAAMLQPAESLTRPPDERGGLVRAVGNDTQVVPVLLQPLDADILKSVVALVGALCAPSADHVEHVCLLIAPAVGVDAYEAVAHLARALLVLYLRDPDAVPLDLKGECARSLAALCVNLDAARDVAAMWAQSRALTGSKSVPARRDSTANEAAAALVPAAGPRLEPLLEPPPDRVIVARDVHGPPPVFAWPAEWRDTRQTLSRRLVGGVTSVGESSPLQSAEHSWHSVLARDERRAGSAHEVARLVASSPSAVPSVFSPYHPFSRAELDLIVETRLGFYAATEGVVCLGRELLRREDGLLSAAARFAFVRFVARSVLLRCAAPVRVRRGIFARRVDRWRLAAMACDALVFVVRAYGPDSDDWKRDFSEPRPTTTSSSGAAVVLASDGLNAFFGRPTASEGEEPRSAIADSSASSSPESAVSAGFAIVYDALTNSGSLLRIASELLSSARADSAEDDDEDDIATSFARPEHRLTKAAAETATSALNAGLNDAAVTFMREAREQRESRLAACGDGVARRGAGARWWRARCEIATLELLSAIADVETAFIAACRKATRAERASSRSARAIVSSARGPPSSLAALATSRVVATATHEERSRPSALAIDRTLTLESVLADESNDVEEIAFFGGPQHNSLLVELAKRVAPAAASDRQAALAIDLMRRLAVAGAADGDAGRLRAALACFAEDDETSTRADFAARLRDNDDGNEEDDDQEDESVDNSPERPRDLALRLLAETTGAGAEEHSVGHWLLGLDEASRVDRGCLAALVELAFSSVDALGGAKSSLVDWASEAILKRCSVAERALDVLCRLTSARRTRAKVVEEIGSGLPRIVEGARLLAEAAAATPGQECAALNCAARAALDLAAVSAHAAKLPGVELSDSVRDRARAALLGVFLREKSGRLETLASLFNAALESSAAALDVAVELGSRSGGKFEEHDGNGHDDEERRALATEIGDRRSASVELTISISRLCVVAVGYARQDAEWLEPPPSQRQPWEDDEDEDDRTGGDPDARRVVAAVATTTLKALLDRHDADAEAAEAAAHAVADSCATLRALASESTGDDFVRRRERLVADLVRVAANIGAALIERDARTSGTVTEAYRGHLHVALAHVLGARVLTDAAPLALVGVDDDRHAISVGAWSRICLDAAHAATPWVRLAAASALSAAACDAATRDASFLDDLFRSAGLTSTAELLDDEHLLSQRIETTLAALLRLSSRRQGAHALAERGCASLVANHDACFRSDRPRCLLLSLELVRALLCHLPRHSRLHREARHLVRSRDHVLSRLLIDDRSKRPSLSAARATAAYVGLLASLESSFMNGDQDDVNTPPVALDDARRSALLWSLLAIVSKRVPYWPLPPYAEARDSSSQPPPWLDDDATWWVEVEPADASDEALRAATPARPPSRAAVRPVGLRDDRGRPPWTLFDDDKLRCFANTWARLLDFARRHTNHPGFDLDAILAALAKANHLLVAKLCDADTPAAFDLNANANFVLQASLHALADRLCPDDPNNPRLHDRKLHAAKVLAALDRLVYPEDDDFVSRLKKRLLAALSFD